MAEIFHHMNPAFDPVPFSRPQTPGNHASPKIGFVGLGTMGFLMARNLANYHSSKEHPPLLVWNRSIDKSEKLLNTVGKDKAQIAQNLEEVALECNIIITSLANDAVVKSVFGQIMDALKRAPPTQHKILVETSTIYPTLAGELDALVSTVPRLHLITCPVLGSPAVAEKAELLILMSGDYRSKKEVAYNLVPAMGKRIFDLGENLEKAPTFKLLGNSMILGTLEIMSEAYTLAEKSGINSENVHELVKELLPGAGTVRYSNKILESKFDGSAGFAIDGGIKDASHIQRLTSVVNSPMPIIDVAHQHLLTARAIHHKLQQEGIETYETLDWSAIVAGTRVAAGLDGFGAKRNSVDRED